jgi:hypothetical protein
MSCGFFGGAMNCDVGTREGSPNGTCVIWAIAALITRRQKKKTAWTTNPSHAKPALLVSPATCIRLAQPQWSSQAHAWVMPVSRSTSTPPTVTANVPGHPPPSSLRSYLDLPTTAQTRLRPQTSRSLPIQSALLYRIGTSFATTLSPAFSPLQPSFFRY